MKLQLKILACLVLASLSACQPGVTLTPAATPAPIKIKAGVPPFLSNAPIFIALAEGFFAEQGVEIELVSITSGARSVPMLVSGEVDVLATPITTAVLNASAHDAQVKVVADKGHFEPNQCASVAYVTRPGFAAERKLNGPTDLKGLKINYSAGSYEHYRLETFLATANLTLQDVQLTNLDAPAALAALTQGAVDIISILEPSLTKEVAAGHIEVWRTADKVIADKQIALLVYGPNLIGKNPEAGRRFMVAYLKGVRQYQQGQTDRNLDILTQAIKVDRAILKQACWQNINLDGSLDLPSLVRFQEWAVKNKFLDAAASPEQFWDPSFIDYANQVLAGK